MKHIYIPVLIMFGFLQAEESDRLASFSNWMKSAPAYFGTGLSNTVNDRTNQFILGGAILSAGIAYNYDNRVQTYFQTHKPLPKDLSRFGDHYGFKWAPVILGTSILGTSWVKNDHRLTVFRKLEFATAAISVNAAVTYFLKYTVGRERPNGENNRSFPSGHTSNSFVTAAVAHELFGNTVGTAAYLSAVIVGISRINDNKHYLSDVLVGAGIGTAIGRGFAAQYNDQSVSYSVNLSDNGLKIIIPL